MPKRARILVDTPPIDGRSYKCNQVVEFDDKLTKQLVKEGLVDDTKDAVDYALSMGAIVSVHLEVSPSLAEGAVI